jgi:hypothetical protein
MFKIPWLSCVILWLAYALLGWYLSANHIIWLVGAFVGFLSLTIAWQRNPLFKRLIRLSSQGLFIVIIASIILSILLTSAITWTTSFNLFFIPCVATILAQIESSFVGLDKVQAFLFLIVVAGCGLIVGEIVDLTIFSPQKH